MGHIGQPIQKLAVGQRLYNFGFTDSVLFTEAYMRPRYKGSKLIGAKINEYTDYSQLTKEVFGGRFKLFDQTLLGYINTTKPLDGTFPYPLNFERGGLGVTSFFRSNIRGNKFFPNPYFNSEKDFLLQDGNIPYLETGFGLNALAFTFVSFENQYTGGYFRDRSYGRNPVIEVKTNTIYEFDWGGSTYPEIEKGGSVHIKQILNVDSYNKGLPNVYIVNESTNDSFRVDTSTVNGSEVSILTDNPTEETDFSINLKRSLAYNDVITLDSYAPPLAPVSGPDDIVGGVNALIAATPPFPTKNVISFEPGLGVPSYGGVYTRRINSDFTRSLDGEPIVVPYLPPYEEGTPGYHPFGDGTPIDDFLVADFQNPGGSEVSASTLRNISGSYYYPSTIPPFGNQSPGLVFSNSTALGEGEIHMQFDNNKYLRIYPNGVYGRSRFFTSGVSLVTELSSSLANNNRHFVSFYKDLGEVAIGDLNQIGEPVEVNLVVEIGFQPVIYLKSTPPITGTIGLPSGFGIIIWKAQQGPFAVMKPTNLTADFSYSNLREGGLYREHSTNIIKQHFDDIVRTVGMKKSL